MAIPQLMPLTAMTGVLSNTKHVVVELAERWPLTAITFVTLLIAVVLPTLFKKDPLAKIPYAGACKAMFVEARNASDVYIEGYRKFNDTVFRVGVATDSPNLVIPQKFLNELRNLPDDVLSFGKALDEIFHHKYTGFISETSFIPHTIKRSLTPALRKLNPVISDEVTEAMRLELPQSSSWSEVKINSKLLRIVAMVSGRVFIGSGLCRSEEYLEASINYTVDVMAAVYAVDAVPAWQRPFRSAYCPEVKKLKTRIQQADELLRPLVIERKKLRESDDDDAEVPNDMLQWIIDSKKTEGEAGDEMMAMIQLTLSFAAIHTTTLVTTNALYTLAATPELAPILREDIQQALLESNGVFTTTAMQNMKKLDSFLKEVLRFYPNSMVGFVRKVLKPFTLSSGQTIPAGVIIEISQAGISMDDKIFPDANKFDALRFWKLRMAKREVTAESGSSSNKAAGVVASSQFVSVSPDSLTFGYGRHACPGRFFATNEIKMIVATLLLNYDVENPGGSRERHENLAMGPQIIPDPNKTIMLRKR